MKRITVIFVPHQRAKYRKISISLPILWSLGVGFVLVFLFSCFLTVQFFQSHHNDTLLHKMDAENLALTKKVAHYESHLAQVDRRMKTIERKSQSLALVSSLENGGQAEGVGGVGGLEVVPKDHLSNVVLWQKNLISSLDHLKSEQLKKRSLLRSTPTIAPVQGIMTTGFGMRSDPFTHKPEFHPAVDISCAIGEPVIAPGDGIVVRAGFDGGYGNTVKISHGRGIVTLYAHLSKTAVKVGDRITRGMIVGYAGSTGRSTGPHLHYEVRINNRPVNPISYILDAL